MKEAIVSKIVGWSDTPPKFQSLATWRCGVPLRSTLVLLFLWAISIDAQTLDISIQNKTIPQALRQLATQSDTDIAFSESFFFEKETVTFVKSTTIEKALETILANQSVGFKRAGGRIIIFRKEKKTYTISGYLTDVDSGERLIYANIFSNQGTGTSTNEYGFYSLTLPAEDVQMTMSYIGYSERKESLKLTANQKLNFSLQPVLTLSEIVVTPSLSRDLAQPPNGLSSNDFEMKTISSIPDIGGETDIMRIATMLPGVQSGADGLGGLHVRGGDADQNLMLLDGVPVYHTGHLFNLFSIYNSNVVKSARFLRGGFPARYGGRLSSVFDVRTREGNLQNWNANADLGFATGKLTVEGPFQKNKGSFLLAGRSSIFQQWNGQLAANIAGRKDEDGIESEFTFFDLNGKINYDFGNDRLYFSYYWGRDIFGDEEGNEEAATENLVNWGNQIMSLRWNHLFNQKLFANTTATFSNYKYQYENLLEDFETEEFIYLGEASAVLDLSVNMDFDYAHSNQIYWKFGGGITYHRLTPNEEFVEGADDDPDEELDLDLDDFNDSLTNLILYEGVESFLYFENDWKITPTTKLSLGLRGSGYFSEDYNGANLEPRFFITQKLSKKLRLNASATRMIQYLHKAATTNLNLPDSKWLPPTNDWEPEESWQQTLGFDYLPKGEWVFSAEGFHKTLRNQILFNFVSNDNFGEEYFIGSGNSYGLEMMIQKTGKTGGNLNYTLSRAFRTYEDFNNGDDYPFQFDRRHNINFHGYHQFNNRLRADATFTFQTGNPILPILGDDLIEDVDNLTEQITTSDILTQRTNSYHLLNIGLQYSFKTARLNHQIKVGAYNIYDRQNEHFRRMELVNGMIQPAEQAETLFGILPSVSYKIHFYK